MILYFLNLLDLGTTLYALEQGAVEMNPIINKILDFWPPLFPMVKIYLAFFLCLWLKRNAMFNQAAMKRLVMITAIYGLTVMNNIVVIFLMR